MIMGAKKASKKKGQRSKGHHRKLGESCITSFEGTMELAVEDILKEAKRIESEELEKINFNPSWFIGLDGLLYDTYVKRSPKPIDYQNRQDLLRIFNVMAQEIYAKSDSSPVVEGYGSFVMDMFNEKSDLDLSINFIDSTVVDRQKKISTLRKFIKKLYTIQRKGHITSVLLVTTAKVPIIKLTDQGTGIECDLSVENRDGIAKSHIIHAISAIDERFRKLSFLMKSWAQAHNINSSKDGTLNSLSIVSLVAFHLQTCSPPILPPFSALLKEGADPASVIKVVKKYLNYGKNNRDSLAKLFITLFAKLASIEKLWKNGLCVSLYEGSWILKSWGQRSYSMSIEDFTDPSQNVARAVGTAEIKTIYACIRASLYYLLGFLNGQMQGMELMGRLFGAQTVSTLGIGGTSNSNESMNNLPTLQDPLPSKKRHWEEGLAQNQVKKQAFLGTKPHGMGGMQQAVGTSVLNSVPASFTPLVSHQPPLAIPRTNIIGHHHGYGPGPVPSPFEGLHNLSIQYQPFPSQTFQGHIEMPRQNANAVAPIGNAAIRPHLPPHLPPAIHNSYRGDHSLYNHRRY